MQNSTVNHNIDYIFGVALPCLYANVWKMSLCIYSMLQCFKNKPTKPTNDYGKILLQPT